MIPLALALLASISSARSEAQTARPPAIPAESLVVSTAWLAERIADPSIVVLHVDHDSQGYQRAHIPGARFVSMFDVMVDANGTVAEVPPADRLEQLFEALGVSDASRVVLYGEPMHVGRAFIALEYLGHGRTSVLDGGVSRWRTERRRTSDEVPRPARGSITPRLRPEIIADAAWMQSRLNAPRVAMIDTRSLGEYLGTERVRGAGHLAGARRLAWQELLAGPPDELTLKDRDTLMRMYRALGADRGDTVVTYCRVGMRASVSYVVARWLGFDARMYDGSWVDWSARGLPVVKGDTPNP